MYYAHEKKKTDTKSCIGTKRVHKTTKFNHGVWVKSCTDINTELRKKGKYNSEKEFFNLRNDAFFGETVILTERY